MTKADLLPRQPSFQHPPGPWAGTSSVPTQRGLSGNGPGNLHGRLTHSRAPWGGTGGVVLWPTAHHIFLADAQPSHPQMVFLPPDPTRLTWGMFYKKNANVQAPDPRDSDWTGLGEVPPGHCVFQKVPGDPQVWPGWAITSPALQGP